LLTARPKAHQVHVVMDYGREKLQLSGRISSLLKDVRFGRILRNVLREDVVQNSWVKIEI